MQKKTILPTLLITLCASAAISLPGSAHAWGQKKTFFSDVDKTIRPRDPKVGPRIIADRYFRLMARINVWALYCDPGNKMGYSTRASHLQRSAVRLEKLATRVFGGDVPAYNRFERYRNEESLRFIRSDRNVTCPGSEPAFLEFTDMKPTDLEGYVSQEPFGSI